MSEIDPAIVPPAPLTPEAGAPIAPVEPDAVPARPASFVSSQPSTPIWLPIALWIAFVLVTLVGNSGALRGHAFLWTDRANVADNAMLNSLGGLQRIWAGALTPSTFDLPQYAPVAQASFFIDRLIWGDRVAGFRMTSCLLHATCGLMIWWLLRRLAVPGAMVIALLFVAHPMTVESVSLLSERRMILAGLFGAAGLFLALRGAGAIGPVVGARFNALPPEPSRLYALSATLLALALFAHPAIFAIVGVLLLVLWWKRRPIDVALVSLCLGAAVAGVALLLVNATIERDFAHAPAASWNRASSAAGDLAVRTQVAGRAVGFYVQKLLLPFPLMTDYPRWQTPTDVAMRVAFAASDDEKARFAANPPDVAPGDPLAWLWPIAVVAIAGGGIGFAIARGNRGATVLIASFLLLLLPLVGFVDLGWMRNAFVADHFAYLASVPLLVGIVVLVGPLLSGPSERVSLIATLAILVAAYVLLSANISRRYIDAPTFWSVAADVKHGNRRSPLALQEFADAVLAEVPPNVKDAAYALENARVVRPADPAVYVRIARVFAGLGRDEDARQRLRFAMVNFPEDARAFSAAADAFVAQATTQPTNPTPRMLALEYYQKAVEKDPQNADAQIRVGEAAFEIIRRLPDRDPQIPNLIDVTTGAFDQAVQITPYDVDHLVRMARVLVPIGRLSDAGRLLKTAITIDPKRVEAYALIGDAAVEAHDPRGAESAMRQTLQIDPDNAAAHLRLGTLLSTQDRFDEAKPELQKAIDLGSPDAKKVLDDTTAMAATRPSTMPSTAP